MKIGQVGLGYVGLVNAAVLANHGNMVVGIDVDKVRINDLQRSIVPIFEPDLKEYLTKGKANITFSTNYSALLQCDAIFITVPTPTISGSIDLSFVIKAAEEISKVNKKSILIIKSTVVPGTASMISAKTGMRVISNPEFTREGSAIYDTEHPDRIVIGGEPSELVQEIWKFTNSPYVITSNSNAELIKYASNAFLATKISFINQIADLCEKIPGTDVNVIAKGMGLDKRIGKDFLRAGLGFGGSCFPKDTKALISFAESNKVDMSIVREVYGYNESRIANMIQSAKHRGISFAGSIVCVLGLSFKDLTNDLRESRSLVLISELQKEGAVINAYDPVIKKLDGVRVCDDLESCISESDIVITATEWKDFSDIPRNLLKGKRVLDLRRILDPEKYEIDFGVGLGKN
ncbi:MAG: UDP-glucose/GDP-mannose dehydrogenase family protein [Thermoplasmatales archaeon]|nr:UDP-glucose/GDP-mannose dehydrogenase family protein [Thermoplasmatales archaeon]